MRIRAEVRRAWTLRGYLARRAWLWLLIKLRILKLYIVDYGESDWVSARSEAEAEKFWREFQAETAGIEWVQECEDIDGIVVVRTDPNCEMRDEDGTKRTAAYFMIRQEPPAFIGSSVV